MFGNDFCARCDAAAAMPVIRDQLARVRTDTIEQVYEIVDQLTGRRVIEAIFLDVQKAFSFAEAHPYKGISPRVQSVAVRGVSHEH